MTESSPISAPAIISKNVVDEMKTSYLDYSMSVLVGRALPDVRDGLKPVHRRVLYTMHQTGLLSNKPYRKSANVVGNCMARFHPHGDASIYDTLVRMAQDFSMRYPLVDGQGNFGSVDGDNAAAMRYTEARLSKIASELLADIEKETVTFAPNFDGSAQEPTVLPSKLPNLLVNGSSGIAVGMATNIPPHNLGEVADAIIMRIQKPDTSTEDILSVIKGPDFPTGGIILGTRGIRESYLAGRGNIKVRARTQKEMVKDRARIIVTEIPYQVNKSMLIEEMAALVRDKRIAGISDIRDESDRDGMRIVIELRKDAVYEIVENQLFMHTRLETSFGSIFVGLINNQPTTLTLMRMLDAFIEHRTDVVRKRTAFDLRKAQERLHILDGLMAALARLDFVIEGIRKSADADSAKSFLVRELAISEIQAQAILDLRLQRLASLEREKIKGEHRQTTELIVDLKSILSSPEKVSSIIISEVQDIKKSYADERRTEIRHLEDDDEEITDEDLIPNEQVVVTITRAGYIKRIPIATYRTQNRGGKGVSATGTREEDVVDDVFTAKTHSYLLCFTNTGDVHWLKVYQVPEGSRQAMGKAIVNLLSLGDGERVAAVIPIPSFNQTDFLVFATQAGVIKKTALDAFSRPRKGGIIAITLEDGDALISVEHTQGSHNIIMATKDGMAVRFTEQDVRPTGRGSKGVTGIRLREKDSVVSMVAVRETDTLLSITEKGYGKRSVVSEYRFVNRGGKGVINFKVTDKTGSVVAVCPVSEGDELLVISRNGQAIRTPVANVSLIGRNTQGVRVMKLSDGDSVVAIAKIPTENGGGA